MEKKEAKCVPVQQEVRWLTIEQIKQLLEAAREHHLEPLMTVAITTGLRRGELLGLCWQDIDIQNQSLHVRRMVSSFGIRASTETARTIALPTMTMNVLREHQIAHVARDIPEHDFHPVFSNEKGQPLNSSALRQQYYPLFVSIGHSQIRFHDLRYSTAAFFYEMGVNIAVIHSILGFRYRSNINILTPVTLAMQQEAMTKWDEVFDEA